MTRYKPYDWTLEEAYGVKYFQGGLFYGIAALSAWALCGCGGSKALLSSSVGNTVEDSPLTGEELLSEVSAAPGTKVKAFAHYPRPEKHEGKKKRKRSPYSPPAVSGCTMTLNDVNTTYAMGAWRLPPSGVTYYVNLGTVPPDIRPQVVKILQDAFAAWEAVDQRRVFVYGGTTNRTAPRQDGTNTIAWGRTRAGIIAATYVWYDDSGEAVEVDTVFNNRFPWAVFNANSGECQSTPVAYDVQDIATHEFGHWIGLLDLYGSSEQDLTMYGYSNMGELKKRTLGAGDRLGVIAVAQ